MVTKLTKRNPTGMVGAELAAIRRDFENSSGWFVYYTAPRGGTLFGEAMGDAAPGHRLKKSDVDLAGAVRAWAMRMHLGGCFMAQRKNQFGDTEYVLKRREPAKRRAQKLTDWCVPMSSTG